MDSFDLSNLQMPQSGSRLLSEPTPDISSSSSRTGPGGDDLSLSELSLSERAQSKSAHRRPFSLLARPESADESAVADEDADDGEEGKVDETMTQEDIEKAKRLAAKTREEKLQHDLFVLKKLNAAFEVYKDALRETKSSTDRVAIQLQHTNALLDKYVRILDKSEKITKLILDERWQGAEAVYPYPCCRCSTHSDLPIRTRSSSIAKSRKRKSVQDEKRRNVCWQSSASANGWNVNNASGRRGSSANAWSGREPKQPNRLPEEAV
ncbi:hypothetical protein BV20DRAFT_977314 [Pilatotrama ljubarskyi]|nr:hypothetical protein BV20DRAFT_977314 [Pilatotrama ljubarskyi]